MLDNQNKGCLSVLSIRISYEPYFAHHTSLPDLDFMVKITITQLT